LSNGTQDRPLRILILAAEAVPLAKTGEVADVISGLAKALHRLGHDVRVAMPRYSHIDTHRFGLQPLVSAFAVPMDSHFEPAAAWHGLLGEAVPVYLIDSPRYFGAGTVSLYAEDGEQSVYFGRAVLEMLKRPEVSWCPDLIHCHDWQTAIVPNLLRTIYHEDPCYADTATVFTIHRLSHQGVFGYRVLEVAGLDAYGFLYHADINDLSELVDLLARGIYYADAITTVSPHYAEEIQTPEYGERLDPLLRDFGDHLFGVTNGIDTELLDPERDSQIASCYSLATLDQRGPNKAALQRAVGLCESPTAALIGMVSRLADDKGFDLLGTALEPMLSNLDMQMMVVGVGEGKYHELLKTYAERFAGRLSVRFTYSDALERQIYAGSDMFLMPSHVEPCGLGQMIAMRYGSVPIVRATGGLADTVRDYDPATQSGNGFVFGPYDAVAMYTAVVRAVEAYRHPRLWRVLQERGMGTDSSWTASARRYVEIYRWTVEQGAQGHREAREHPAWLWFAP
jgi:starch synthase